MNTIVHNYIVQGLAWLIEKPFKYFISININPYIIFVFFILFIFLFYFIIFYQGQIFKFFDDYKKMTIKQRRSLFIFLFGGILIAFIMFYHSLNLFYDSAAIGKYHPHFIDNLEFSLGDSMMSFLEKVNIIK